VCVSGLRVRKPDQVCVRGGGGAREGGAHNSRIVVLYHPERHAGQAPKLDMYFLYMC